MKQTLISSSSSSSSSLSHHHHQQQQHQHQQQQQQQQQQSSEFKQLTSKKEASWWVWDQLWSADQAHVSFDILDVIRFQQCQITSWIFTMVDNKIKSKSKSRWNIPSVRSRCSNSDDVLCGHILKNNTWEYLPSSSDNLLIDDTTSAIISTAQMNSPYLLVEVVFEKQSGILAPKVTCYRLCDSSVLGKNLPDQQQQQQQHDPNQQQQQQQKSFPTQRLQITSKGLTEVLKEKIISLVNILESRSKQNIQKISCVFVVEDYKNCATNPDYKIKLHHTTEVIIRKKSLSHRSSSSMLLSESGYSEVSEITTSARGYIHKFKCEGDFCQFHYEEEGAQLQLSEELEFNINRERKHAIQRNRSSETGHRNREAEEEEEDDDEIYRSTVLAATTNPFATTTTSTGTGAGAGVSSTNPTQTESVLQNSSESFKISMKSIYLARNEMKILDSSVQNYSNSPTKENNLPPEVRHWSPILLNWYYRVGRSVIQKYSQPVVPIPASSGHKIGNALLNNHQQQQPTSTSNERNPSNDLQLTSSTLKQINTSSQPSQSSHSSSDNLKFKDEISQLIPYDLNDNSYHPTHTATSSKHLGRYYSSGLVCERCYQVYKQLNSLRKHDFTISLKSKKEEEIKEKNLLRDENSSLYLSQRMNQMNQFANQRIATYRLAQSKHPPPAHLFSVRESLLNQEEEERGNSHDMRVAGAPKGVLPPLPWQLQQEDRRQEYQQQGSAFIRNIQNKTQKIIALTTQQNEEFYSTNESGGGGDVNLETNYDWKKTLISRYSSHPPPSSSGEIVKSKSAGGGTSKRRGADSKKGKKKKFNHERLLHPYQRYFEQMKRDENEKTAGAGRVERELPDSGHHQTHHSNINDRNGIVENYKSTPSLLSHSHSPSQQQPQRGGNGGGAGRLQKTKSFNSSLLTVLEDDEQQHNHRQQQQQQQMAKISSSSKNQNTSSGLLPPLVPKAPSQSHQSPSKRMTSQLTSSLVGKSPKPMLNSSLSRSGAGGRSGEGGDGESDDDEEDDDDGIGWSPFVVSLA